MKFRLLWERKIRNGVFEFAFTDIFGKIVTDMPEHKAVVIQIIIPNQRVIEELLVTFFILREGFRVNKLSFRFVSAHHEVVQYHTDQFSVNDGETGRQGSVPKFAGIV